MPSSRFDGAKSTRDEIGISASKWSTLSRLTNGEPLNQGRHRGSHLGDLRNATINELGQARDITKEMIDAFNTS